jgi:hypothetical protein
MAGFSRSNLLLVWPEDHELHGLEIRMKRLSVGDMFYATQLAEIGEEIAQQFEQLDDLFGLMCTSIVSWNMNDPDDESIVMAIEKGEPRKGDKAATGMFRLDVGMFMAILETWLEVAGSVPDPLPKKSNSSKPVSQAEFDLMAALSGSQPLSNGLNSSTVSSDGGQGTPIQL